jgi:hypothetical protein
MPPPGCPVRSVWPSRCRRRGTAASAPWRRVGCAGAAGDDHQVRKHCRGLLSSVAGTLVVAMLVWPPSQTKPSSFSRCPRHCFITSLECLSCRAVRADCGLAYGECGGPDGTRLDTACRNAGRARCVGPNCGSSRRSEWRPGTLLQISGKRQPVNRALHLYRRTQKHRYLLPSVWGSIWTLSRAQSNPCNAHPVTGGGSRLSECCLPVGPRRHAHDFPPPNG